MKFHGEENSLIIGTDCTIREGVTMNPGTEGGGGKTIVGNGCTFLANSHVAHDCVVEDHVILINSVALGGHAYRKLRWTVGLEAPEVETVAMARPPAPPVPPSGAVDPYKAVHARD